MRMYGEEAVMSDVDVVEAEVAAPAKFGRQEMRTKETRELLMAAAKTIFVRDGYEGTDLNDIAELAGRTKGAIYGHFKSKEEIFLALVAEHRKQYQDRLTWLMSDSDVEQNIAVMRAFVLELVEDSDWALLQLEFKMFALRHPEAKERFLSLFADLGADREERYTALLGPAGASERSISRAMAVHSVLPMLTALLLEAKFEPGLMSPEAIQKVIAEVFDCLVGSRE
jgi:AcrR family transcriptional regulator